MKKQWMFWAGLVTAACAGNGETSAQSASLGKPATPAACVVAEALRPLPEEVRETSGLTVSRRHPGVLWTHNDSGGDPVIYALGTDGSVRARVTVLGVTLTDWEDIEAGECDGGGCLYIADIGDNAGRREYVTIYEVKEPELTATTAVARPIHARYEDGPQDAEALVVLPSGEIYIVTKGRHGPIRLYKYSAAGTNNQGTLQMVREIATRPTNEMDRVTAATASPDGRWVVIRSYANLFLYRTKDLMGGGSPVITYSLADLRERQGEAITLDDSGTIWVTSEAEQSRDMPAIARLTCALP